MITTLPKSNATTAFGLLDADVIASTCQLALNAIGVGIPSDTATAATRATRHFRFRFWAFAVSLVVLPLLHFPAEADFECAPSTVKEFNASDQAFLDAAMGPGVRRTARSSAPTILEPGSRDPAEQAARDARRRREAKQQACDDAAQAEADAKARSNLEQQRREHLAAANASIAARIAQASPDVQAYVAKNPSIATSAAGQSDSVKQNLISLYSADIVLRVCRERYGEFQESIARLQELLRLTEAAYQQLHQVPASDIAAVRTRLGVDSGEGQLIDYARSSRDLLRSCNEFIALYRLSAPLAR